MPARARPGTDLVVKIGGAAALDPTLACADIGRLVREGVRVTVVHGGSASIDQLATRLQVPVRRLTSPDGVRSRYTDREMLAVVTLALAGLVKPRLVAELLRHDVPAVGLTGLDGGLLRARPVTTLRTVVDGRTRVVRDNRGGRLQRVDPGPLAALLRAGCVPVLSPPALGDDGEPVNVDADQAAAAVAVALGAPALVLLTAAAGVMEDPGDPDSLLRVCRVAAGRPPAFARDGMARKLRAAATAVGAGVALVVVGDGRHPEPVRAALAGAGTRVIGAERGST